MKFYQVYFSVSGITASCLILLSLREERSIVFEILARKEQKVKWVPCSVIKYHRHYLSIQWTTDVENQLGTKWLLRNFYPETSKIFFPPKRNLSDMFYSRMLQILELPELFIWFLKYILAHILDRAPVLNYLQNWGSVSGMKIAHSSMAALFT